MIEEILFHMVELANDLILNIISIDVSTELQLKFDLVRHAALDDFLHVFPVRVLISEAAAL